MKNLHDVFLRIIKESHPNERIATWFETVEETENSFSSIKHFGFAVDSIPEGIKSLTAFSWCQHKDDFCVPTGQVPEALTACIEISLLYLEQRQFTELVKLLNAEVDGYQNPYKDWTNFGDVNFWEYGILVKRHWENKEDEYDILKCNPDGDSEKFYVRHLYVDITDSWFKDELDDIAESCDCKTSNFENEYEKITFAIALVEYYNNENFQPSHPQNRQWNTAQDAYEWLLGYELGDLIKKPE